MASSSPLLSSCWMMFGVATPTNLSAPAAALACCDRTVEAVGDEPDVGVRSGPAVGHAVGDDERRDSHWVVASPAIGEVEVVAPADEGADGGDAIAQDASAGFGRFEREPRLRSGTSTSPAKYQPNSSDGSSLVSATRPSSDMAMSAIRMVMGCSLWVVVD